MDNDASEHTEISKQEENAQFLETVPVTPSDICHPLDITLDIRVEAKQAMLAQKSSIIHAVRSNRLRGAK